MRISRLDRYVATEVLAPFLGGASFFLFIFMMFQGLRLSDLLIVKGAGGAALGKLAGYLILSFLPTALPAAFLFATLAGFGRLSADSELVAMKASGRSLGRLCLAPLALAIAVGLVTLRLNTDWCPWAEREFKRNLIRISNTKVINAIKQGTFTSGVFDLLIYAEHVDNRTNRLENVFIYDEREPKNPLTIVAQHGELLTVKTASEFSSAAVMRLHDGTIHSPDLSNDSYQKIDFGEYNLYLKADDINDFASMKPRMYSEGDLKRIIGATHDAYERTELQGEYWRRYAVALSPLIFVFLGIGFGTVRTRSVRAGASLVSVLVLILYWTSQAGAAVLLQRHLLPPPLAMQIPNLMLAVAAVIGFRRAAW
jgi:lipopolysaccharide export system permease protein